MSLLALPEREIAVPPPLEEGVLERTKHKLLVATGSHIDSMLGLYETNFERLPQASIFLYPSTITLNANAIARLDARFDNTRYATSRKFDDVSPEVIYSVLSQEIKPLMSFMNHRYSKSGAQVHEYSFSANTLNFLIRVVKDLKIK